MIRIIIADDHAIVRKGIKQLISEEYPSAEFGEAGDVETLIEYIIKKDWDVVICDITMPGRSGLEALQQIKQIKPDLPVLIMSMHSEDQYALRVLKAGASGYLNKDTVHDDLIRALQTIRLGRKFITPSIAEKLANALGYDSQKKMHEFLSDREFDVFKMIAAGKSVSEIAEQLNLSATTISTYRSRILEKMGMKTNADLTRYALENSLI
ncbi:MAG: DNA-binding response regulator [Sphingobacteriales bacterium 12-47-4]|nr:MAG: DNA-binding response regulator [Sphingobacteriales bacterium 12-47-4]